MKKWMKIVRCIRVDWTRAILLIWWILWRMLAAIQCDGWLSNQNLNLSPLALILFYFFFLFHIPYFPPSFGCVHVCLCIRVCVCVCMATYPPTQWIMGRNPVDSLQHVDCIHQILTSSVINHSSWLFLCWKCIDVLCMYVISILSSLHLRIIIAEMKIPVEFIRLLFIKSWMFD